jgi:Chromosome segregation ATPases
MSYQELMAMERELEVAHRELTKLEDENERLRTESRTLAAKLAEVEAERASLQERLVSAVDLGRGYLETSESLRARLAEAGEKIAACENLVEAVLDDSGFVTQCVFDAARVVRSALLGKHCNNRDHDWGERNDIQDRGDMICYNCDLLVKRDEREASKK